MINCNPETVSTDFDTADKLYFEPVFGNIFTILFNMKNLKGNCAIRPNGTKLAEKLSTE
jgi:carbamoyl-phosphate synthase large subunit